MEELNNYEFEVHFRNEPNREITQKGKTQQEALFIAEQAYQNEPGYLAVISIEPHKI
ncbi:hypothetical protein [Paenibacillus sp. FSL R5-0908]|uniref:hypothetical protein n=1 Tax=Paenibacillus sp. FSL R5-0908 TaxID=2921664 RepID=UPI0030FA8BDD